jgi:O-antigen/teichoic acid export membrane protein
MLGLVNAISSIIYGIKEPAFLLKVGCILICMSIGFNLLLIPKYGAIGAVIATSIPRLMAMPIYIHFVSRKIKQHWPMNEAVRTVLAAAGMGLIVFFIQYDLSAVLGLSLGVPVGIIVYLAALLAFKLVKSDDIRMLKQFEERLPSILKHPFAATIGFVGKLVKEDISSSNHIN